MLCNSKWIPILVLLPLLAACGGRDVPPARCPGGAVLATAESLPGGDGPTALLFGVSVECEKADAGIDAEITVYGDLLGAASETTLPLFVALVDKDENVLARAQGNFRVKPGQFKVDMPVLQFDPSTLGSVDQAAFLAGVVLTDAELKANRATWRDNLNIN